MTTSFKSDYFDFGGNLTYAQTFYDFNSNLTLTQMNLVITIGVSLNIRLKLKKDYREVVEPRSAINAVDVVVDDEIWALPYESRSEGIRLSEPKALIVEACFLKIKVDLTTVNN
ncbi:hypothetical protein PanWU01x14_078850 [Parasponia andersonii]|uniref:Uncharacterized protein n=1 Tax=Parasponia andersonii TaxID=3476 RepID=A0A2P5DC42_PARAD|nr:hypothetical protein PanWU01x14_078850 [Parasponia andersonii]